jgi:hypothetical protein
LTTGPEASETAFRLGRKSLCGGAYGGVANGILITQDPLTKGPDDPTVSYKDNLFAYIERVAKEYLDAFDQNRRINRYVYVCNNPINFIDPLGLEDWLIIVPGTRIPERGGPGAPDWARAGSADVRAMQSTFRTDDKHTSTLEWTQGNSREARSVAAETLRSRISSIRNEDSNANITVVGHSHGGNAAIEASNGQNTKIDHLVTLGTPVRDDYRLNSRNIGQHTNIYDTKDTIQSEMGGYTKGKEFANPLTRNKVEIGHREWGAAGRRFPGAANAAIDTGANRGWEAHIKLHDVKVWRQQIDPVIKQQREQKYPTSQAEQKQVNTPEVKKEPT